MSKRLLFGAVAMIAVLMLAACGDDSGSSSSNTAAASAATTAAGGAGTSAAAAPTSAASAGTTAAGAAAANATVTDADNSTIGQKILVDSAGMTIYLFEPDGTSQTSTVPAGIKANWPAVVATSGTAVAGPDLDATKLTVVPQPDGTKQVAYNGHLLYTFVSDTAPGQANGQDLGGAWYVISPSGDQVGD